VIRVRLFVWSTECPLHVLLCSTPATHTLPSIRWTMTSSNILPQRSLSFHHSRHLMATIRQTMNCEFPQSPIQYLLYSLTSSNATWTCVFPISPHSIHAHFLFHQAESELCMSTLFSLHPFHFRHSIQSRLQPPGRHVLPSLGQR
jgi:hypothetical protein